MYVRSKSTPFCNTLLALLSLCSISTTLHSLDTSDTCGFVYTFKHQRWGDTPGHLASTYYSNIFNDKHNRRRDPAHSRPTPRSTQPLSLRRSIHFVDHGSRPLQHAPHALTRHTFTYTSHRQTEGSRQPPTPKARARGGETPTAHREPGRGDGERKYKRCSRLKTPGSQGREGGYMPRSSMVTPKPGTRKEATCLDRAWWRRSARSPRGGGRWRCCCCRPPLPPQRTESGLLRRRCYSWSPCWSQRYAAGSP